MSWSSRQLTYVRVTPQAWLRTAAVDALTLEPGEEVWEHRVRAHLTSGHTVDLHTDAIDEVARSLWEDR